MLRVAGQRERGLSATRPPGLRHVGPEPAAAQMSTGRAPRPSCDASPGEGRGVSSRRSCLSCSVLPERPPGHPGTVPASSGPREALGWTLDTCSWTLPLPQQRAQPRGGPAGQPCRLAILPVSPPPRFHAPCENVPSVSNTVVTSAPSFGQPVTLLMGRWPLAPRLAPPHRHTHRPTAGPALPGHPSSARQHLGVPRPSAGWGPRGRARRGPRRALS